jgi:hypothetical protein
MEEDWEKTLILFITLIIIGGFYISPRVKKMNMSYYFALILILFFICIIQRQYLKNWKEDDKKTDYTLVYWLYNLLSIILFLFLIYVLGLNPKIKNLKGGANMYDTDVNISSDNNMAKNLITKGIGTVINGISAYTNFWRNLAKKVLGKSEETNYTEN